MSRRLGGENAASANKYSRNYRHRCDSVLPYRQVCSDGRLANLLKILVALICLAAILQRLLPAFDINLFLGRSHDGKEYQSFGVNNAWRNGRGGKTIACWADGPTHYGARRADDTHQQRPMA